MCIADLRPLIRKDLSCGPQPNHCMTWIQVAHIKAEPSREPNSYLCLHEQDDLLCLMKTAKKIRNTAVTSYLCVCQQYNIIHLKIQIKQCNNKGCHGLSIFHFLNNNKLIFLFVYFFFFFTKTVPEEFVFIFFWCRSFCPYHYV